LVLERAIARNGDDEVLKTVSMHEAFAEVAVKREYFAEFIQHGDVVQEHVHEDHIPELVRQVR
jgi:hypothetical protein